MTFETICETDAPEYREFTFERLDENGRGTMMFRLLANPDKTIDEAWETNNDFIRKGTRVRVTCGNEKKIFVKENY